MTTPYPQPNQPQPPAGYAPVQPQPGHYSGGYFIPTKRPFSHLAVGGFIASFLSFGLIGVPLSIAGLVTTQRKPEYRGSGLAVFGIVIGVAWSFFNIAAIAALFSG